MTKKGAAVWVSAILYFGIGIIIITILLTAGLPVINKLKDKNVIIQTKQVMHTLDESIRDVIREGPGSQRVVTVNLKKGELQIDDENNKIIWVYRDSNVLISEPNEASTTSANLISVMEGKLKVITIEAAEKGRYDITIELDYAGSAKLEEETGGGSLIGLTDLVVRNEGLQGAEATLVTVSISQTN